MRQEVAPVLVAYHTWRWIKVAVGSYQRHFPGDPLLIVDNNPAPGQPGWQAACEAERAWLRSRPNVTLLTNEGADKRHGAGLDAALEHCRQTGVEILLHFEPDCLITGRDWYEALWKPLNQGAWMSGSHRKIYGPIHPTPSMWRVDRVAGSFADQPRGMDAGHPRFQELVNLPLLLELVRVEAPAWEGWWREHWDTAQRNWFHAAAADRAALIPPSGDFEHFWCGSMRPDHPALLDPRVLALARS